MSRSKRYDEGIFNCPESRFKIMRIALQMRQVDIAEYLQVTILTVHNWENGIFNISHGNREKLRHVGINLQWIDYGTGKPFALDMEVVRMNITNKR